MGEFNAMRDDFAGAAALYREALGIQIKACRPEDIGNAFTLTSLGAALKPGGRLEESVDALRRCLAIVTKNLDPLERQRATCLGIWLMC